MAAMRHDAPIVTVFGGTGFLGRYVIWRLARAGYVIRVPTRNPDKVLPLMTSGTVGQVTAVPIDIYSQESVQKAIQGSDYVINLIGTLLERSRRLTFRKIHAEFPTMLAALARQNGIRQLVHVSALGANLLSPSLYACTKATGEVMLKRIFPKAVVLRPGILFGDEDNFINKFARMARFFPVLPLIGGGRTLFQPAYVGDVADAVVRALTDPGAEGKTYVLAGPRIYSFEEILLFIQYVTGQKRRLFPVPFEVMKVQAWLFEKWPHFVMFGKTKRWFLEKLYTPPITRDQLEQLKTDNIVTEKNMGDGDGFAAFGITPAALEAIAPRYLTRYRAGGRFAKTQMA